MFICMGCQGNIDENGKFNPTPCMGLNCTKKCCTSKCTPSKKCEIVEKVLKLKPESCNPECSLRISCGNSTEKCRGCAKTQFMKSVIKHGKILCNKCPYKKVEVQTDVSSKT